MLVKFQNSFNICYEKSLIVDSRYWYQSLNLKFGWSRFWWKYFWGNFVIFVISEKHFSLNRKKYWKIDVFSSKRPNFQLNQNIFSIKTKWLIRIFNSTQCSIFHRNFPQYIYCVGNICEYELVIWTMDE